MLEVVDDTLAVEEIHGRSKEIPVESLCETQLTSSAGNVGDGNDLLEGDDLDGSDDDDDVDVTGEHCDEEEDDHDESPDSSGDEGLLLLFIFALRRRVLRLQGDMLAFKGARAERHWLALSSSVVQAPS